ncbi:hypothetical protein D1Y84_01120 [Acidipila sp. EB88]|nr:hypothetical protein D1Y84_01120 [Acidipila sp. EB88]
MYLEPLSLLILPVLVYAIVSCFERRLAGPVKSVEIVPPTILRTRAYVGRGPVERRASHRLARKEAVLQAFADSKM